MYDIIRNIINHTWITQNAPGDQQILYYMASVAVLVLIVVFIDMVYKVLSSFIRHFKL